MAKLTQEEIELLQRSPHVASVNESGVTFTPAFKLYLAEQKQQGRKLKETLRECGIEPEILGRKRLENLSYRLNRGVKAQSDFEDKRKFNGRVSTLPDGEMELEARVRWLAHELEYTKQEVEFLKKLQMANMEARKQWESKHQPK